MILVWGSPHDPAAVDYRYPGCDAERPLLKPVNLPDPLARRCVDLATALDLPLAGIDLRHGDDGEWYCFEANPSPAFPYYEDAAGVPIADSIAGLLCRESSWINHDTNGSWC